MISCESLFQIFEKNNLTFFTGVPDSTFKDWMAFLADEHSKRLTNLIQPSECEAIASATGYNLATNRIPIVYMQNSGLGKCINPLTSLCDEEVYSIPLLMMIGWRGEPGKHDEPQHIKMGRIMLPLLDTLEIPYKILPNTLEEAEETINELKNLAEKSSSPVALIIKPDLLEKYEIKSKQKEEFEMTREESIKLIVDNLANEIIVSTTGKISRELWEYRIKKGQTPIDFYTVGSMGCASSIAHSIALQKKDKKVIVLDGDGAALMQLGAFSTIGYYPTENFYHIILDNQSYESTGEQPTVSSKIDFEKIALACGYNGARTIEVEQDLVSFLKGIKNIKGPYLLVVKVNKGSRKDLGRPKTTPLENKEQFKNFLSKK